jgi:hypothetical protein
MASLAEKCSPAWRIKIAVARPWSPGTNVSSDSGPNQWAGDGVPVGHSNPNSQSYRHHADLNHLRRRIRELNAANKMDGEIAAVLNQEGFVSARGKSFSGGVIHLLRKQWNIATVKINGSDENPVRWPDGSYSVRGAAEALGITEQTVFDWLHKGRLTGQQLAKGMPWRVRLSQKRPAKPSRQIRRMKRSKKEAS